LGIATIGYCPSYVVLMPGSKLYEVHIRARLYRQKKAKVRR
jgi:hypothetical protein